MKLKHGRTEKKVNLLSLRLGSCDFFFCQKLAKKLITLWLLKKSALRERIGWSHAFPTLWPM